MLEEGGVTAGIAVNVRPEALGVEFRFQPEKVFERLVVQVLRMVFESLLQTLLFQPVLMIVLPPAGEVVFVEAFAGLAKSCDDGGVGNAVIEHEVNHVAGRFRKVGNFFAELG